MAILKRFVALLCLLVLAACGGGGGDAGAEPFPETGGGTGGGIPTPVAAYALVLEVQREATATTQITSTETLQAVATVTTSDGAPVEGVVVSFSESQGTLLTFAPLAATALTDASGRASIDLSSIGPASTGATSITASATVGSVPVASTVSIQINSGAVTPDVPPVPGAINFVGSSSSGVALVIKGTGGSGRSESAILTFRIVDITNAPINAAEVDFTLNSDNGGATIAQQSATSNSDGLVAVSVSSGLSPASIVVTATARALTTITSQSDSLLISNSVAVATAFEIVAETYNLDGRNTGDSTTITAFVADSNGNPVPDGVAVSFQTDAGVVATSTQGGCLTVNGICSVDFRVQDPRRNGLATVVATVRVGATTTLSNSIVINMAGATGTPYLALDGSFEATKLTLTSCIQAFELGLSDGNGRSVAAGTTIASTFASTGVVIAIKSGSPVLDQLTAEFPPTRFGFEVNLTGTTLQPLCKPDGMVVDSPAFFRLEYKSPDGIVYTQRIELAYPQ